MVIVIGAPRTGLASAIARTLSSLEGAGVALSVVGRDRMLAAVPHLDGQLVSPAGVQLSMQAGGDRVEATADDLRLINEHHSAQELTADDVVVFQDYACSTARIPFPPIRFTRAYLDRMAELAAQGRSVLFEHDEQQPIGTTFAADVVSATVRGVTADWLRIRWYAVLSDQTSAERRQRVQDCRTGILRYTSIRAMGGTWDFQETEVPDGAGGTTWDYHYLVDTSESANLGEVSRTFLGASTGAGDHKFSAKAGEISPDSSIQPAPPQTAADGGSPKVLCVL